MHSALVDGVRANESGSDSWSRLERVARRWIRSTITSVQKWTSTQAVCFNFDAYMHTNPLCCRYCAEIQVLREKLQAADELAARTPASADDSLKGSPVAQSSNTKKTVVIDTPASRGVSGGAEVLSGPIRWEQTKSSQQANEIARLKQKLAAQELEMSRLRERQLMAEKEHTALLESYEEIVRERDALLRSSKDLGATASEESRGGKQSAGSFAQAGALVEEQKRSMALEAQLKAAEAKLSQVYHGTVNVDGGSEGVTVEVLAM